MEAVSISNLTHRYGERVALANVTFSVSKGEIFGLLGPNGGGKTTLFRILSTLIPPTEGEAKIFDASVANAGADVRKKLGVVFQAPSLDERLTVQENLTHQGHLYGLSGSFLRKEIDRALKAVSVEDRRKSIVSTLSGGLKRRVEIAKAMLHTPELLLLDEPSTGLDPSARQDLRKLLNRLRDEKGMTIVLTTHLMDEAETCDRIALLDRGSLVIMGEPAVLKKEISGDIASLCGPDMELLEKRLRGEFQLTPSQVNGHIRVEVENSDQFMREVYSKLHEEVESMSIRKPTLEDVFLAHTGRKFEIEKTEESE